MDFFTSSHEVSSVSIIKQVPFSIYPVAGGEIRNKELAMQDKAFSNESSSASGVFSTVILYFIQDSQDVY